MFTVSLAHLLSRGVSIEPHEAVAIAQSLIDAPAGVPTAGNVELRSDGTARCISGHGTTTVEALARLIEELLPAQARVPAALRYTLARATGAVEATPFQSVEDFRAALKRFEAGDRSEVITSLLHRIAESRSRPAAAPVPSPTPASATPPPSTPPIASTPRIAAAAPARQRLARPQPATPARELAGLAVIAPVVPAEPERRVLSPAVVVPVLPIHRETWAPKLMTVLSLLICCAAAGFASTRMLTKRHGPAAIVQPAAPQRAEPAQSAKATERHAAEPARQVPRPVPVDRTGESARPETASATAQPSSTATSGTVAPPISAKVPLQRPERAVPRDLGPAFSPAFSSDGTALFYQTGAPRDASSAIAAATLPAGDDGLRIIKVVDDGSRNYHAQPSPDGRLVAFDSDRDGERGVYLSKADGSEVHRISGPGYAAIPTWSPDGSRIAYVRAEENRPAVWNLWVQPAAGGTPRRLTNFPYGATWGASWFPDGRRIAYSHEQSLTILDLQSGQSRSFASPIKGALVRTPAVSPDGTKVIFQVRRHGAWLLDLTDGSMLCVLTDPTAEEFAWAPDGSRIAFHSQRDGAWGIYLLHRG